MLVPSTRYLVPIDDLEPVRAAPLTDAALSSYHALKPHLWRLRPGTSAVVIGVGGLGSFAVQLLRALSPARIVAVDLRGDVRRAALDAGADAALDPMDFDPAAIRDEAPGGAALVLDFVGTDETLRLATAALAMDAHLCVVGHGGGSLPPPFADLPFDASVSRPSWGTLPELHEVVSLAKAGTISADVELFALDEAVGAYHRLDDGTIRGRAVVVP